MTRTMRQKLKEKQTNYSDEYLDISEVIDKWQFFNDLF